MTTSDATGHHATTGARSLLRDVDFRRLWMGQTVSEFGTNVSSIALPLLAVTALQVGALGMGLLTAADRAAFLLVGLPAGAWLDRIRKRPVMLRVDLARAALLASLPIAWWLGVLTFTQLVLVALVTGIGTVFFDVAYQSYLPLLVGRRHLVEGNGKLESTKELAMVGGPAAGGGLVQLFGAAGAVVVDAVSYLVSALTLRRIREAEPAPPPPAGRSLRAEIAEGMRFVLGHRLLRAITGTTGTANFFSGVLSAVEVIFLVRVLGLSAGLVGLLASAAGLGGVLGALSTGWWHRRVGSARTIWLALLVTAPVTVLMPLAQPGWRLAFFAAGNVAVGYGAVVYNVAQVSFRQAICPDHLLARMNASIRFMVWGALPLGGLLGGLLGALAGIRATVWVSIIGQAVAGVFVICSPLRSMRDTPGADPSPPPSPAGPAHQPGSS